jgi:transketolase
MKINPNELKKISYELRLDILDMVVRANGGHIGGSFSAIDLLAVLYLNILKHDPSKPQWELRDRLIYSKGHSCLALYTILSKCGYFEKKLLEKYAIDGGAFAGHPEREFIPGVEVTAGSLGHGHSLAVGIALAAKINNEEHHTYIISSDGELNEGSSWEAIMSASQFKLDNLTMIIDYNKYISLGTVESIMSIDPLDERLKSFGWDVYEIDGHDFSEINSVLENSTNNNSKPTAIIANTIKAKGVSFMENIPMWHFRCPTKEEDSLARKEIQEVLGK